MKFKSDFVLPNLLGERGFLYAGIYLPPILKLEPEKKLPVVYFFHGFGGGIWELENLLQPISHFMTKNTNHEFILICLVGQNKLGGSFYTDSPVTGNWEKMFIQDFIPLIEKTFPVRSGKEHRGIMGFSMGGYGALFTALNNPAYFNSVCVMAPGIFAKNAMTESISKMDIKIKTAYGAVFSPNTNLPYPFAEIPKFNNTMEDKKIVENWENGFGRWDLKIEKYLSKKERIKNIRLLCGKNDPFRWITDGTIDLFSLFLSNGIKSELKVWNLGHEISLEMMENDILPFFAKTLKF